MKDRIKQTILGILAEKRAKGDVQSFLLWEALREYRARLVDELDKL